MKTQKELLAGIAEIEAQLQEQHDMTLNDAVAKNRRKAIAALPPCLGCGMKTWKRRKPKHQLCSKCREVISAHGRSPAANRIGAWRKAGVDLLGAFGVCLTSDGKCDACGDESLLCIDHCHTTGRVRGELCKPCNMGLGSFRDDPERLLAMVEYLNQTGPEETGNERTESQVD